MSGLLSGEEGVLLEYAYKLVDLLLTLVFNVSPYKPRVFFVGHLHTALNQIRRRILRRLIRFSTVCFQKFIFKFEQK